MNPTIWIFSLEPIETRYTKQWHEHLPKLLKKQLGNDYQVVQIDGVQKNTQPTPGAFLNFSDTNYWKSSQMCEFLEHYNQGEVGDRDHLIFTDAWNPVIVQIKYMNDLLGHHWTTHGLWHAGSYDPQDFLGRLIGDQPWVRHAEKSMFHSLDHNYFATDFHINMFCEALLDDGAGTSPWFDDVKEDLIADQKIVRTGWPMEYLNDELLMYRGMTKRNLVLFPHRIAPEKQADIFRDLKHQLPQYEFVVCQEQQLSKNEYHNLLGEAKLVFSANLQETLGISWYEGAVLGAIPMVPDRLSYQEMALDTFKYPSEWTESFSDYQRNRDRVVAQVVDYIENYETYLPNLNKQVEKLEKDYFSCRELLKQFK